MTILKQHSDYAFITSYNNRGLLQKELKPLVATGAFHYRMILLGELGQFNCQTILEDMIKEKEGMTDAELQGLTNEEREKAGLSHDKATERVMFICSFDDDILDLQAQIERYKVTMNDYAC